MALRGERSISEFRRSQITGKYSDCYTDLCPHLEERYKKNPPTLPWLQPKYFEIHNRDLVHQRNRSSQVRLYSPGDILHDGNHRPGTKTVSTKSKRMFEAKLFDEDVIVKFSNFNYGFKVHNYLFRN
jgi:hypothetical protein